MTTPAQRLQDACASFFLFLATFRRNTKTSKMDVAELRASLGRELAKVEAGCSKDHELAPLWERIRYALVTTADQVVLSSPWASRTTWSMQLQEAEVYGTREGGQRFFQLVEQALADGSAEGPLLAQVLFHCMGLGFQGELRNDRAELGRLRQRLFEKAQLPARLVGRLTPEAYDRNSTKTALKLPTVGIVRLVLVGIAATVFALIAGNSVTAWTNRHVNESIEQVIKDLETKPR